MNRYPGNHMDSGIVTVPRELKTRPGAPQTHLAYITGDEAQMLQEHKPGTPHEGAAGIPNYDTWGIDSSGAVTGGSTAGGGGAWSGDTGGNQPEPSPWAGNPAPVGPAGGPIPTPSNPPIVPTSTPDMSTGFGSVFGSSSGTTGSSMAVQTALTNMINQNVQAIIDQQGYVTHSDLIDATNDAYGNFYPGLQDPATGELTGSAVNYMSPAPGQTSVAQEWINDWYAGQATNTGGSGMPGGYGGYYGWDGSNVNYGNPMGRFSEWGRRPFMKQNFDSPVAAALQQKIYGDRHPPQPINQRLFMDMVAGMNKGGIMGVRK